MVADSVGAPIASENGIEDLQSRPSPAAFKSCQTRLLFVVTNGLKDRNRRLSDIPCPDGALQVLDAERLRQLNEQAVASPRKRSHLLLHAGPDDQVQRLVIAAEPGTYVRPHQHSQQWEMLTLLRGRVDVLIFDDGGRILERTTLDQIAPIVQIPTATWHTCIIREGAVLIEIKPGPFRANEFAPWAPQEGHESVNAFLKWASLAEVQTVWRRG